MIHGEEGIRGGLSVATHSCFLSHIFITEFPGGRPWTVLHTTPIVGLSLPSDVAGHPLTKDGCEGSGHPEASWHSPVLGAGGTGLVSAELDDPQGSRMG